MLVLATAENLLGSDPAKLKCEHTREHQGPPHYLSMSVKPHFV